MSYRILRKNFGTHAILLEWPQVIHKSISLHVRQTERQLLHANLPNLSDTVVAYSSLCLFFDHRIIGDFKLEQRIDEIIGKVEIEEEKETKVFEIDVCYDPSFSIDLEDVSTRLNMSPEEIIKRHVNREYTLCFYGFLPGFMYLSGMDEELNVPRLKNPRLRVPAGSVAIAEKQTGIYPQQCPGGWNIIGRSNFRLFDASLSPPCAISPGDKIRFRQQSLSDFNLMVQ